MELMDIFQKYD
jgi:hypothetical protein